MTRDRTSPPASWTIAPLPRGLRGLAGPRAVGLRLRHRLRRPGRAGGAASLRGGGHVAARVRGGRAVRGGADDRRAASRRWPSSLTTYVVNMRHYLMAATLAPGLLGLPARLAGPGRPRDQRRVVRRGGRASESTGPVVVHRQRARRGRRLLRRRPVGTGLGGLVADPARWGLDFAFPAVFLALVGRPASRPRRLAGGAGQRLSWRSAIALVLPGNWHIIIAGVAVSAVAALVLEPGAAREGPRVGDDRRHGARHLSHARAPAAAPGPDGRCRRACGCGCA